MKKIDKRKIFLVIIIILILLVIALFIGKFTFSYLAPDVGEDVNSKGEVTASGDTIIFNNGKSLSLSATTDNFTTGGTNLTSTTNPTAKLVASSKTNKADATYYVGVHIKNNTYTYSTAAKTPEVLLTIKDEKGNNVTSVDGLTYTTSGGVSGFDVTDKTGLFNIKTDYPIATTSSTTGTTHTWTFTLTFVNLSTDQSVNENANMNLDVYLQKNGKFPASVTDVCSGGETLASCVTALSKKSISPVTNIYHHTSTLANGAGDNSYRFAGGEKDFYTCTYNGKNVLTAKSSYSNVNTECQTIYQVKLADGSIHYFSDDYIGFTYGYSFSDPEQYDRIEMTWNETTNSCYDEKSGYYFTDINGEPLTKELCTGKSYNEYGGISPISGGVVNKIEQKEINNYVCFGSTASPCPTDNLYRIIGVFGDQVKLIKYDYANSNLLGTDGDYSTYTYSKSSKSTYKGELTTINRYYWNNSTKKNTWSESLLNKTNLNINFINNIGTEWAQKIAETTWKVGGNTYENIASKTPSVAYQNEIVNPVTTNTTDSKTEYKAKVGLMYASDYGFAAAPSAWTSTLLDYDGEAIKSANWMYIGLYEWTISRDAVSSDFAFDVYDYGRVGGNGVVYNFGVRPSFNLESSTTYVSGSGSVSDPMVIN